MNRKPQIRILLQAVFFDICCRVELSHHINRRHLTPDMGVLSGSRDKRVQYGKRYDGSEGHQLPVHMHSQLR